MVWIGWVGDWEKRDGWPGWYMDQFAELVAGVIGLLGL